MNKIRVLIVDDDHKLSQLTAVTLEKTNLYESRVENKPLGILAAAREFKPHLILLDVDMPGKDGGAVEREIRSDAVLGDTPVLFFTGLVSHCEARGREVKRGGSYFLAKPVRGHELVDSVQRMLKTSVDAEASKISSGHRWSLQEDWEDEEMAAGRELALA